MTTIKMQTIRARDGATIAVAPNTSAEEIAILKVAVACAFSEFVYIGNSSQGTNKGNYDDLESWLRDCGLTIKNDDLSILIWKIEKVAGVAVLTHRGKTLRYHAQGRCGESNGDFGYRYRAEYRLISCQDAGA